MQKKPFDDKSLKTIRHSFFSRYSCITIINKPRYYCCLKRVRLEQLCTVVKPAKCGSIMNVKIISAINKSECEVLFLLAH